jgi:hypothetical protein
MHEFLRVKPVKIRRASLLGCIAELNLARVGVGVRFNHVVPSGGNRVRLLGTHEANVGESAGVLDDTRSPTNATKDKYAHTDLRCGFERGKLYSDRRLARHWSYFTTIAGITMEGLRDI